MSSQNFSVGIVLTSKSYSFFFFFAMFVESECYSFSLSSNGNLTLKWNNNTMYLNQRNSFVNVSLDSPVLVLMNYVTFRTNA